MSAWSRHGAMMASTLRQHHTRSRQARAARTGGVPLDTLWACVAEFLTTYTPSPRRDEAYARALDYVLLKRWRAVSVQVIFLAEYKRNLNYPVVVMEGPK